MAKAGMPFIGLTVSLNKIHGTNSAEMLVPWLHITHVMHETLGGISRETLGQWC